MDKRWTKGLSKENADRTRTEVKACASVVKRIKRILEEDLSSSTKQMSNKTDFDSPAWSEKIAYSLGEQARLRNVITLLSIEE